MSQTPQQGDQWKVNGGASLSPSKRQHSSSRGPSLSPNPQGRDIRTPKSRRLNMLSHPGADASLLPDVLGCTPQPSKTLMLPRIQPNIQESCCAFGQPKDSSLDHAKDHHPFSIRTLAWAIQNGLSPASIQRYLAAHPSAQLEHQLSFPLSGEVIGVRVHFPIIFFACERNLPELVRILCQAGTLIKQYCWPSLLPALAYTSLLAEETLEDTTDTIVALLANGANPHDLPADMWENYLAAPKKLPTGVEQSDSSTTNLPSKWCTPDVRLALSRTFNLTQRYFCWKAASHPPPTIREMQVATAHELLPLYEIQYHIIGQQPATNQVRDAIMSHYLFGFSNPLVLLFAGPSGHGKTELAKRMGQLLSLPLITVDCASMRHESDIFGPKAPYFGSEEGSPLNNYLADHNGRRVVVFLDEFDKTTKEVWKALLLPFESGAYFDRRNGKALDCSKTIWVLASNHGEEAIRKYYHDNLSQKSEKQLANISLEPLQNAIKASFIEEVGAPLTGRLTTIVPFLPFAEPHQAVATYKFMREFSLSVRKPISVSEKQFARHTYLNYIGDGHIARTLAKEFYIPELGARSLKQAVVQRIGQRLAREFFKEGTKVVDEMNEGGLASYDVKVASVGEGMEDVVVSRNGERFPVVPGKEAANATQSTVGKSQMVQEQENERVWDLAAGFYEEFGGTSRRG